MHIMFFTERAYHDYPEDEIFKRRSFFGCPTRFWIATRAHGAEPISR